mmetsp:Transcript_7595/g.11001  ORF Transcript_7595/g.11001 Transcript_7595/m.11001 type:complete len:425 (+) Transcript_7595:58-1332(+)
MTGTMRCVFLFLLLVYALGNETPEAIFRRTVREWRSQRSWTPWINFTQELLARFESEKDKDKKRLEIVGAFEEGILAIEKLTVAKGDGDDPERDASLSQMYYGYGKVLVALNPNECLELALDPHTLLIGAETVSRGDEASTDLCVENAENAIRNAATLDATNAEAAELLVKITGEVSVHKRKPKEFVAELFDSFADSFDEKLGSLGYKVPKLVGDAAKALKPSYRSVLDAGCGTGLAGRFLRPLVTGIMIGVDASQKMLDIAAKCTITSGCGLEDDTKDGNNSRPLYEGLLVLDLEDITLANSLDAVSNDHLEGFDLIVAADVLVYFGDLTNLLQTFANVSTPGAALVFSCERSTDQEAPLGFRLLASGRFAHTKHHAVKAASDAGYELLSYEQIVPRMEKGEEVRGHLFGFVLKGGKELHAEL